MLTKIKVKKDYQENIDKEKKIPNRESETDRESETEKKSKQEESKIIKEMEAIRALLKERHNNYMKRTENINAEPSNVQKSEENNKDGNTKEKQKSQQNSTEPMHDVADEVCAEADVKPSIENTSESFVDEDIKDEDIEKLGLDVFEEKKPKKKEENEGEYEYAQKKKKSKHSKKDDIKTKLVPISTKTKKNLENSPYDSAGQEKQEELQKDLLTRIIRSRINEYERDGDEQKVEKLRSPLDEEVSNRPMSYDEFSSLNLGSREDYNNMLNRMQQYRSDNTIEAKEKRYFKKYKQQQQSNQRERQDNKVKKGPWNELGLETYSDYERALRKQLYQDVNNNDGNDNPENYDSRSINVKKERESDVKEEKQDNSKPQIDREVSVNNSAKKEEWKDFGYNNERDYKRAMQKYRSFESKKVEVEKIDNQFNHSYFGFMKKSKQNKNDQKVPDKKIEQEKPLWELYGYESQRQFDRAMNAQRSYESKTTGGLTDNSKNKHPKNQM